MDDLIRRQAALDAIIHAELGCEVGAIWNLPPVDAVEVVRCRDCKYCSHDVIFSQHWCVGRLVDLDDFCSRGERK